MEIKNKTRTLSWLSRKLNKFSYLALVSLIIVFAFWMPKSGLVKNAEACTDPGDLTIDLKITPTEAAQRSSILKIEYGLAATSCAKASDLADLQWYIFEFTGTKVPLIEEDGANFVSKWVNAGSKTYYINNSETWQLFTTFQGRASLKFYAEVIRKSDGKILAQSSGVPITLAGTCAGNCPPTGGNNTNTNTGNPIPDTNTLANVSNADFDANVAQFFNPINITSVPELLVFLMKGFLFLIGIIAVVIIIIGGFRMVISQGNSEAITKAKQTIIWAVIGLVVALLSFSMISIVQNLITKQ